MQLFRRLFSGVFTADFTGLLLFIVTLLAGGTFFYSTVEGWTTLNALYFSATTLTTVGYGDLVPRTDLGKLFTVVYMFVGIGTVLIFMGHLARHAARGNPLPYLFHQTHEKTYSSGRPARRLTRRKTV